jgi:hypothetical protein
MTAPMTTPAGLHLAVADLLQHIGLRGEASSIAAISAPSSETTARPRASTTLRRAFAGDDALEHLTGQLVGERAGVHELLQRADRCRRDER